MDKKIAVGVGIITLIIVIIAAFTVGNKSDRNQNTEVLGEARLQTLLRTDTHLIKAKTSKVTIVEFGDFQCPACGIAHIAVKQIKNKYKNQVNFAFREFPLTAIHQNAYTAAMAAEAAGGQGKFWEMHDKLYENQSKWSDKKDPMEIFTVYAKELGLNIEKFKEEIKQKKYDENITNDQNDGAKLGINATPTFFINGKMYSGVLKFDDLTDKIEIELNKKL